MLSLTIASLLLLATSYVEAASWDYDTSVGTQTGPANWHNINSACGGNKQSPIDIVTTSATVDNTLTNFTFQNYEVIQNLQLQVINNGHSAQVTPSGVEMTLSGGGLSESYKLWQFHFHWGASNTQGSEHTIDGTQYALELHLVHYKGSYASPSAAVASNESDALAVLGFMFDIVATDNPAYVELVIDLAEVTNRTINHTIVGATFDIDDLFEEGLGSFYRYEGSLTTPSCNEIVVWSVFEKRLHISQSQLDSFRNLLDSSHSAIEDNYRHVQNLNGRTVTKYNNVDSTSFGSSIHNTKAALLPCVIMYMGYLLFKSSF